MLQLWLHKRKTGEGKEGEKRGRREGAKLCGFLKTLEKVYYGFQEVLCWRSTEKVDAII